MQRTEKIRSLNKAQAYFLTSEKNVCYASGFKGDSSLLLITQKEVYFFTDFRYTLQAQTDLDSNVKIITITGDSRRKAIGDIIKQENICSLGIEKGQMNVNEYETIKEIFCCESYEDISSDLLSLRSVKTPDEIKKIKIAASANEKVLDELIKIIKPGISELDLRAELLYQVNKQGMDSAFAPIVASGENSALPHAIPTSKKLAHKDLLTLDFGCKYLGYCSDITRTFVIGAVDETQKKIYDIVNTAQMRALEVCCEGVECSKIDAAARDYITSQGYGEFFGHGTGHGVGLDIHENPTVNSSSKAVLEKGMVYTVEPGIYLPGIGGVRIEDTCVVGEGSLYNFSKELIFI